MSTALEERRYFRRGETGIVLSPLMRAIISRSGEILSSGEENVVISLTSEYALKALVFLTQQPGYGPVTAHVIAENLDIPSKYLSRILRDLVTADVLSAMPGRTGGFRLACDPKTLRLSDALAPFERVLGVRAGCPFGNKQCDDVTPCAGHCQWSALRNQLQDYLRNTTIHDVSVHPVGGTPTGRRRFRQ